MIEITNLSKQTINQGWLLKKVKQVLRAEKAKNQNISICLLSCAKIKDLNKKFRNKNKATDVLTFPELDILICPQVVKEDARRQCLVFEQELCRVVIHGLLHFLGYEHEAGEKGAEEMRKREEKYSQFKIKNTKHKN